MQHDSIFRCIDPACGRTLPRSVNFCPYCGTAQAERAAPPPAHAAAPAVPEAAVPQAAAAVPAVPAVPAAAAAAPPAPAPASAEVRPAAPQPVPPATTPGSRAAAAGGRPLPPPPQLPPLPPLPPASGARAHGAGPAAPPKREPVRLRWWILALAVLWGVWLLAKPSTRRIEAQMDKAITLARECKPRDAQTELIALRKTKATAEQLQQVQTALNDAAGMCTRKRQRDKAWREAKSAVEAAIGASSAERARQRLRAFTKRWGEDADTRVLKQEIDARWPEHRRADEF